MQISFIIDMELVLKPKRYLNRRACMCVLVNVRHTFFCNDSHDIVNIRFFLEEILVCNVNNKKPTQTDFDLNNFFFALNDLINVIYWGREGGSAFSWNSKHSYVIRVQRLCCWSKLLFVRACMLVNIPPNCFGKTKTLLIILNWYQCKVS